MAVIDSGPVAPTDKFDDIPKTKWRDLVRARKSFLAVTINYDCRCLIEFCNEAEQVWRELGYQSAEDMIRNGYKLNPEETKWATEWLRRNDPQAEIGLSEVSKRIRIQQLRQEYPQWTQQQIADEVGCSQPYVNKAITENSESEVLVIPDHINSHTDKADFRKLPDELRQRVAEKKLSLNAAAIRAGIRKKPTPLSQLLKWWKKATAEERKEFLKRKDDA